MHANESVRFKALRDCGRRSIAKLGGSITLVRGRLHPHNVTMVKQAHKLKITIQPHHLWPYANDNSLRCQKIKSISTKAFNWQTLTQVIASQHEFNGKLVQRDCMYLSTLNWCQLTNGLSIHELM